jgi:hypothetical protein
MMKKLLILFAAGCLGGLINSIAVWLFGQLGITSVFGVSLAPQISPEWLYPRIVWGGIWGGLLILPIFQSKLLLKATLLSLLPTAVQLFVVFPMVANKGIGGIELGMLTPIFVIFYNWVWAIVSIFAIKYAK